jgi:hypothetical protein
MGFTPFHVELGIIALMKESGKEKRLKLGIGKA